MSTLLEIKRHLATYLKETTSTPFYLVTNNNLINIAYTYTIVDFKHKLISNMSKKLSLETILKVLNYSEIKLVVKNMDKAQLNYIRIDNLFNNKSPMNVNLNNLLKALGEIWELNLKKQFNPIEVFGYRWIDTLNALKESDGVISSNNSSALLNILYTSKKTYKDLLNIYNNISNNEWNKLVQRNLGMVKEKTICITSMIDDAIYKEDKDKNKTIMVINTPRRYVAPAVHLLLDQCNIVIAYSIIGINKCKATIGGNLSELNKLKKKYNGTFKGNLLVIETDLNKFWSIVDGL